MPPKRTILRIGSRHGRLKTIRQVEGAKHTRYLFRCDCGNEKEIDSSPVARGITASCGCLISEAVILRSLSHGHNQRGKRSTTYNVWSGMLSRCSNYLHPGYKNYGGRGITVCKRWESFENFLTDMGCRPAGMSIDRINNDGNYEPGNCRWATRREQNLNMRRTIIISAFGEKKPLSIWAEAKGMPFMMLYKRIKKGMSPEDALTRAYRKRS